MTDNSESDTNLHQEHHEAEITASHSLPHAYRPRICVLVRLQLQVGDDEAEPGSLEFRSKLQISTAVALGCVIAGYIYFWRYEWHRDIRLCLGFPLA